MLFKESYIKSIINVLSEIGKPIDYKTLYQLVKERREINNMITDDYEYLPYYRRYHKLLSENKAVSEIPKSRQRKFDYRLRASLQYAIKTGLVKQVGKRYKL